jgi:hypothetical protein
MDDDSEDDFEHLLQAELIMLASEQQDEFEDKLLACVGLVCYGFEEARHNLNSVLRRSSQRLYLTRPDLLPES